MSDQLCLFCADCECVDGYELCVECMFTPYEMYVSQLSRCVYASQRTQCQEAQVESPQESSYVL